MIVNKEAYDWLFPTVDISNILINTWFLSKESIGIFKCEKLDSELILKVIKVLNDNINKLTELSIVTDNMGVQEYRLIYDAKNKNDVLNVNQLKINDINLKTVTAIVQFPLKILRQNAEIIEHIFYNSTEILFSLETNIIDITIDYGSILAQNNTLLLTIIYLFNLGFIKRGNTSELYELRKMSNNKIEISNIITTLEKKNGLTLSDQEYQYIENCVIVVNDEKQKKLDDNFTLSSQNCTQFESFIKSITQILKIEFEYRTIGIF